MKVFGYAAVIGMVGFCGLNLNGLIERSPIGMTDLCHKGVIAYLCFMAICLILLVGLYFRTNPTTTDLSSQ
jgi:hypothetical protein